MPIEIRELHIKVTVDEQNTVNQSMIKPAIDHDSVVSDCVDQVMEILNNKMER